MPSRRPSKKRLQNKKRWSKPEKPEKPAGTEDANKKKFTKLDQLTDSIHQKGIAKLGAEDIFAVDGAVANEAATSISGPTALRSSIADLFRLGASLQKNYRYLATEISTSSLLNAKNENNKRQKKGGAEASAATSSAPAVADAISTEQIWGQLTLLAAPVLQDISANLRRLDKRYSDEKKQPAATKAGKSAKSKKIAFDDEDEIDDEDLDLLEEDAEDDENAAGSDDNDDDDDDSDALDDDDPELARLLASRKSKNANKKNAKSTAESRRLDALMAFAKGGDDGENDEEDWAAEFETRKADDEDDEDGGGAGHDHKPTSSKRAERLAKKFGNPRAPAAATGDDEEDLDGFGDDGEEAAEDEEDGDALAELYGDDFEGGDDKFVGEDEEDDDVHGTSDEEGEEKKRDDDDDDLYDAEEDSRYQRNMFPTDKDDGFDNILDDREGKYHYKKAASDDEDEDGDEEEDANLTDFQLRQRQEKKFIGDLEQKRAFNADWAMTGEVEGRARPKDSLVDEELDFEYGMKSVPVITEGLTAKLEERIKKRILDQNFDDVVRRQAATTAADLVSNGVAKRDTTQDSEKSKASLMDLYEKDFLAKLKKMEDAAGMNDNIAEPLTEMEKDELKAIQMWKRLSQHLDALSNYYFTPKPVQEDLNVRIRAVEKAAPAISMESVGAFAISKASAIAPQDTFRPAQKSMLGNVSLEEMTPRERQALRRSKKEASTVTKARVEKQTNERKKRRTEIEAAKSK